ncbi:MAG: hypothetical protein RMH75_07545 [Archaeoglobaceae archaeon]|nr:hypothetical protein [Archaeoglobaceae archaeon]
MKSDQDGIESEEAWKKYFPRGWKYEKDYEFCAYLCEELEKLGAKNTLWLCGGKNCLMYFEFENKHYLLDYVEFELFELSENEIPVEVETQSVISP